MSTTMLSEVACPGSSPTSPSSPTSTSTSTTSLGPSRWRSAPWPPCKGRLHGSDVTTTRLLVSRQQLPECVNEYELFKNEIKILSEIQLANIVKLMGYCTERSERVSVYEYMQNGSLEDVIFGRTRAVLPLDWPSRFRIIEGITHGADYLHNHPCIRIIHKDLKLSNILLDSDMNPKISNFDLAEMITSGVDRQKTNCVIGSV